MKIPLSPRLLACCNYISPGDRVADIGCDHGYLGIHLLTTGVAAKVIAADINQGPLGSALRNSVKFGVRDKMQFFLSDGVQNISRDFDTLVCAGMGADTIISILSSAPWLKSCQYKLILQCQSKTPQLRRFLSDNGWQIAKETLVEDGRFLYSIMQVVYQSGQVLTPGQCYCSPALLASGAPELPHYFRRILGGLRTAVQYRPQPELAAALAELESQPQYQWLKENAYDDCQ